MIRFSDKLQLIGSSYLQQVIRILTVFVMARLIGPSDNGIFMLVIYVSGLLMAFGDFVIPQSVVQIREFPEDAVVDTALVLNGLLFAIYGLSAVVAGICLTLKDAGHNPQYWRIGVIYGITVVLGALYSVQLARINRRLEFRAESWQNIIFALSTAITGIVFAVLHYGAYALALQLLAGQLAANLAINLRVPLSWPRHASWAVAKRILRLGGPASLAGYVRSVEASIIGLIIMPMPFPDGGTWGVGLWSKTIQVQALFGQNLLASFARVAFPLVCHSVSNPERMRKLFARVTLTCLLVSLLFTAVVTANCEALVRVCLGRGWSGVTPLLLVAAWSIPAAAFDAVANILCMALGMTTAFVKSSVLNLCLFVPAAFLIRHLGGGLIGLAICWSASRYLIALATLFPATRRLQVGLRDIWKPLLGLAVSAAAAWAAMVVLNAIMHRVRLPIRLVVAGLVGTLIYVVAAWLLEPDTIGDAIRMARGSGGASADALREPEVII